MGIDGAAGRSVGSRGSRAALGADDPAGVPSGAAAAVLASVPAWWEARARAAGLDGLWLDVRHAVAGPHLDLPEIATPAVSLGASGEELGLAYVTALADEVRSRHGRHYTPTDLAAELWAMARRALALPARPTALRGLVRDPACGAGALLLPALREHLAATADAQPELVLRALPELIEGSDLDPHAAWLASVVLAAECLPTLARVPEHRREPLPALASVGDGLAETDRKALVEIQNPPFGRIKLPADERERFTHLLTGHANLYGLFLGHRAEQLAAGGVLAALTPTSFTSGAYFTKLRAHLAEVAPLREIAFVSGRDGVFDGVLQEVSLATFTRNPGRTVKVAHLNGHRLAVATVAPMPSDEPWLLPRRPEDAKVAAKAAAMPLTLASAGWSVSTGPLVWNRRKADLFARPGKDRVRVVWGGDITDGRIGRDPGRDDKRYLRVRSDKDARTNCLTEPAILIQRTTAPEQSRRLVTAELTQADLDAAGGRVAVENHVNVVRAAVAAPALSAHLLARLLASDALDTVLRCLSGSVAVSAFELEALPLPSRRTLAAWEGKTDDELALALATTYGI